MNETEQIAEIAHGYFGVYPCKLVRVPTMGTTLIYEIRYPTDKYFLKTTKEISSRSIDLAIEAECYKLLNTRGVPCPEVLVLDTSCALLSRVYFLMNRANGIPLDNLELTFEHHQKLFEKVGVILRSIHSIKLSGFGDIDIDNYQVTGKIEGYYSSWQEYIQEKAKSNLEILEKTNLLLLSEIDYIPQILSRFAELEKTTDKTGLLHGDFTLEHIFVNPKLTRITSIIDLGEVLIGDPIWDFVSLSWNSLQILDYVQIGYGILDSYRDNFLFKLSIYKVLYALRVLVWALAQDLSPLSCYVNRLLDQIQQAKYTLKI